MTKHRPPLSVHAALDRIAGTFPGGYADLAERLGRKEHTCRAWADPARREKISVEDAIRADLEFQAAGGIGAPLFETYSLQLEEASGSRFALQHSIGRLLPDLLRENSEAEVALVRAAQPDATEADRRYAGRETGEAIARMQQARLQLVATTVDEHHDEHHQTGPPAPG